MSPKTWHELQNSEMFENEIKNHQKGKFIALYLVSFNFFNCIHYFGLNSVSVFSISVLFRSFLFFSVLFRSFIFRSIPWFLFLFLCIPILFVRSCQFFKVFSFHFFFPPFHSIHILFFSFSLFPLPLVFNFLSILQFVW